MDLSHGLIGDGANLAPMAKGIRVAPVPNVDRAAECMLGNHEAGFLASGTPHPDLPWSRPSSRKAAKMVLAIFLRRLS